MKAVASRLLDAARQRSPSIPAAPAPAPMAGGRGRIAGWCEVVFAVEIWVEKYGKIGKKETRYGEFIMGNKLNRHENAKMIKTDRSNEKTKGVAVYWFDVCCLIIVLIVWKVVIACKCGFACDLDSFGMFRAVVSLYLVYSDGV